jgi:hypothetical protein
MNNYCDHRSRDGDDPSAALVAQLLQTTGCLMLIIDHMARWAESGRVPDGAPPFNEVLAALVAEAIEPVVEGLSRAEIEKATAVLAAASDAVGEEVLLVPIDGEPCRPPARLGAGIGQRPRR